LGAARLDELKASGNALLGANMDATDAQ
jgi:hypothetical protein